MSEWIKSEFFGLKDIHLKKRSKKLNFYYIYDAEELYYPAYVSNYDSILDKYISKLFNLSEIKNNKPIINKKNILDYCVNKDKGEIIGFKHWYNKMGFIVGRKNFKGMSWSMKNQQGFNGEEVRISSFFKDNEELFDTETEIININKPYKVFPIRLQLDEKRWIVGYLNSNAAYKFNINYTESYADPKKYKDNVIYDITKDDVYDTRELSEKGLE